MPDLGELAEDIVEIARELAMYISIGDEAVAEDVVAELRSATERLHEALTTYED